jgi:RHS repeat-associated protein
MSISESQGVQDYKFTGKELDMMNGLNLYDFEARTYDPALGRFLSVDPMAEKKPWMTPYSYCSNNPLNRIDPTGKTDYNVSRNGYITDASGPLDKIKRFFSGPDKIDRLIAKDGKTLEIDAGKMSDPKYKEDSYGNVKKTSLHVEGLENSEKVHTFLSENTIVEFSNVNAEKNGVTVGIISTEHQQTEVDVSEDISKLKNIGAKVFQITHSHPTGDPRPSGYAPGQLRDDDKKFVNALNDKYPNNYIIHKVYDPINKKYYYYNEKEIYRTEKR